MKNAGPDYKQQNDPKDDIQQKFVPEGGDNIFDDLGPGAESGKDVGVGTPGKADKPFKLGK